MKNVLIITNHRRDRSPGQRFRFEQYIDYLSENGFSFEFSNLFSESDDEKLYSKGNLIDKFIIQQKCHRIRKRNLSNVNDYDIVFIFREALITGSIRYEKAFSKSNAKLIYDFDDAIWIPNVSYGNKNLEWLKNYGKTKEIIKLSDFIITGNYYLKDYADKFNDNVIVIPTTINTTYHIPLNKRKKKERICIGWTGSKTTIKHFDMLVPVLQEVKKKYKSQIYFKMIGDEHYKSQELELQGNKWNFASEIADLQEIDIGIMPLPDDEWANGKCGFKGLQYMALEIPTIMSPIGVNTEIIEHSKNGFLAKSDEEWVKYLSLLIEQKELRSSIGKEGRKTVIDRYSVESQKENYLSVLNNLISN